MDEKIQTPATPVVQNPPTIKKNWSEKIDSITKGVELLNKILTLIVVVFIGIVTSWTKSSIDNFINLQKAKIDEGNYANTLYDKFLSDKEGNYMRQDVAISILYNTFKNDISKNDTNKKEFIIRMATIIAKDLTKKRDDDNNIPLEIIQELDPLKAAKVKNFYENHNGSFRVTSNPDINKTNVKTPELDQKAKEEFEQINKKAGFFTVFIQVKNDDIKNKAENLRTFLKSKGPLVPSIEKVDENYSNSIRFFNAEDRENANLLNKWISENNHIDLTVKDLTNSGMKAPKGQIEIWLSELK